MVKGADYPLTIIIVGIGKSDDFISMEILDGEHFPLYSYNMKKVASRDMVKFL